MVIVCSIFYSYVYQRVFFEVLEQSKIANTHWTEDTEALACAAWFAASHNPQVGTIWRGVRAEELPPHHRWKMIGESKKQLSRRSFISSYQFRVTNFGWFSMGKNVPSFLRSKLAVASCILCRRFGPSMMCLACRDLAVKSFGQATWPSGFTLW